MNKVLFSPIGTTLYPQGPFSALEWNEDITVYNNTIFPMTDAFGPPSLPHLTFPDCGGLRSHVVAQLAEK